MDFAAALLATSPLRASRVVAVWLFGSHARGDAHAGSDVDLGVLCEPPLDLWDRARAMDEAAGTLGVEVDVVDMATAPPSLAWEIITTGRLLVERDELAVERFVRNARYAADDDERRNRMIVLAQTATDEDG